VSSAEAAKAELDSLTRLLAPTLAGRSDGDLHQLLDRVPGLVALDVSMAWCLPRILPPEIQSLQATINDDDLEAVKEALPGAVAALDAGCGRISALHQFRGRIARLVGADIHGPSTPLPHLDEFAVVDLRDLTDG